MIRAHARMQRESGGRLRERLRRARRAACGRPPLRPARTSPPLMCRLQSTVNLLPVVPAKARACGRFSSRPVAVVLHHLRGLALGQQPILLEPLAVDLARRRVLADRLVHDRLGRGRLVRLVVAVAAVADEVDDDVLAEFHAVVEREARDEDHRFGVVGIHVEDRRLDHLGDVAAIERRARVCGLAGREADLVVDHDVQRPAGREAPRLRELQRLHDDALPRKRRVAVDEKRQNRAARGVAALLLPRAHRTLDHGIHHLEVRRVEREHDVDVAARRAQVRREALVILDVTGAFQGVCARACLRTPRTASRATCRAR